MSKSLLLLAIGLLIANLNDVSNVIAQRSPELSERERDERERDERERDERDHHRELAERIEHVVLAAEHLERAGMPDLSEEVRHRAEQLRRESHEHGLAVHVDRLHAEMNQLRREVAELREIVGDLRRRGRERE